MDAEWKAIYKTRASIERLNGRLKGFYGLNSVRVRGRHKVKLHAMLSIIVLQVHAVAFPNQPRHSLQVAS